MLFRPATQRMNFATGIHTRMCVCVCVCVFLCVFVTCIFRSVFGDTKIQLCYGVATISRLLRFYGLFCKRALLKRRYSANETYNLKEPTT